MNRSCGSSAIRLLVLRASSKHWPSAVAGGRVWNAGHPEDAGVQPPCAAMALANAAASHAAKPARAHHRCVRSRECWIVAGRGGVRAGGIGRLRSGTLRFRMTTSRNDHESVAKRPSYGCKLWRRAEWHPARHGVHLIRRRRSGRTASQAPSAAHPCHRPWPFPEVWPANLQPRPASADGERPTRP